jgi:hypothetical protein
MTTVKAAILILSLMTCGAHAQGVTLPQSYDCADTFEGDAGMKAAVRDGYDIVEFRAPDGSPEARLVADKFVADIVKASGEPLACGFEYALVDLNGDGLNDVVLKIHWLKTQYPKRAETTIFAFVLGEDKQWKEVVHSRTVALGTRTAEVDGKELHQIAVIGPGGYSDLTWTGDKFKDEDVP